MQSKLNLKLITGLIVASVAIGTVFIIIRRGKRKLRRKLSAKIALQQYKNWNYGKTKEGNSSTMPILREYWKSGAGVTASDSWYISNAWSAAFISWIMRTCGYDEFKRSGSHSVYIRDAIKNKKEKKDGFKGYKPEDVKVEVGDLVCYPRQSGVTYDTTGAYQSHCDIVVSVKNDEAKTIGGNVSDSVFQTIVPLKNGKIDLQKKSKYFVVIKPPKS